MPLKLNSLCPLTLEVGNCLISLCQNRVYVANCLARQLTLTLPILLRFGLPFLLPSRTSSSALGVPSFSHHAHPPPSICCPHTLLRFLALPVTATVTDVAAPIGYLYLTLSHYLISYLPVSCLSTPFMLCSPQLFDSTD